MKTRQLWLSSGLLAHLINRSKPASNCDRCLHIRHPDGGHCYMFREYPGPNCAQFKEVRGQHN